MPKGGKVKSNMDHLNDGTIRQDRHGIRPSESDNEKLD